MHGTRSCYVQGCRRTECARANRDYQRAYWNREPVLLPVEDLVLELLQEVRRYRHTVDMEARKWLPVSRSPATRVKNAEFLFERILEEKTYPEIGRTHGVSTNSARERVYAGAPVVALCLAAIREGLRQ